MAKHIAILASLALAAIATPVAAQDAAALEGHWTGIVAERGSIPRYTLSVRLNRDRQGQLVGIVQYDAFPCAGVWSNATFSNGVWSFDETIVENQSNCAEHVRVEIRPNGDAIDVRLGPTTLSAAGTLTRRP